MGKRIAIAVLLLPAAEIAVFLLVAWAVGFLAALGLMVLTSLAGAVVLRHAGRGQIAGFRALRRDGTAKGADIPRIMFALGGILLLLPGFITDLVGAGLLIGPIRRRLAATIGHAIRAKTPTRGPGAVIDLTPDEWQALPDRRPPPRREP